MSTFKSKLLKVLLTMSLVVPFATFGNAPVSAEGPTDPAPEITAKGTVNGKKILFDNTHGQTAGAADWVIDGAFSDFANGLANNGFYVKELRKTTEITLADLSNYDVFVIPEANIPYKATEQAAMLQYVQNGGAIFFIGDHYNADRNKNRWDANEVFNGYRRGAWTDPKKGMGTEEAASAAMAGVTSSDWLGTNFGIRFRYNALGDVTANNIVSSTDSFGITAGVSTVASHAGSTMAILDPNKAKGIVYFPATTSKWASAVDQGNYNGGGIAEGPYAAISKVGAGKAAFIGDSSPVEDATPKYKKEENGLSKTTYAGWSEQNDATFLINTMKWLATKESYTSFSQTATTLSPVTTLHSWEAPASSTEPQVEPWATPAAGYKWWDQSTFKAGSYGYGTTTTPPPTGTDPYAFVYPSPLPTNGTTFQLKIVWNGLTANTSSASWNIGMYTSTGTQVAKTQNASGTWPTSYGYSEYFSVTADSTGHAEKTVNMQIQSGTTGSGNIRLRQSTTAKYTLPVTF
jgi:hypothetical protein